VSNPPTEAASKDRWQPEADEAQVLRPGIVASLLRYRLVVVAATLLGALAGYSVAQLLPVRYEAQAMLVVSEPGGPTILGGGASLGATDRQVYLAKQVDIMTSSVVLRRAVELLGSRRSLRDVKDELDVAPSGDMASIAIVATGPTPRSAAALANAVATAYDRVSQERAAEQASKGIASLDKLMTQLQGRFDASPKTPDGRLTLRQQQLAGQIRDLQDRQQEIAAQAAMYASGVELFERAELPDAPIQPKPKLAMALGGLLGLLAAGGWAWWAAARNQRAEGRGDPARILGAPLLGEVPRLRAYQAPPERPGTAPLVLDSTVGDAYHFVVASLEHELAGIGGKSIAMTSVGPRDGKTWTALQIANAASQENRKILLIDADVRMRHLSELSGSAEVSADGNGQGLATSNGQPGTTNEYICRLVSTSSGMVLPVAANHTDPLYPAGSYQAVDVRQAVRSIGELFDLVLIDTPAVLVSSNALTVAGQADGVVLVVSHRVSLSQLRDVRERLSFVKTPLIGYVYLRPRGFGVRTLWERLGQSVGTGTGLPTVGPGRERRA
jgi:Mrp family chromosome partitioning ATPase